VTAKAKKNAPPKASKRDAVANRLRKICLKLPETTEGVSFGNIAFRAGKRPFVVLDHYKGTDCIFLYVDPGLRETLLKDNRFFAAYNEVGVLLSQMGNLREALKVYLKIIEDPNAGDHRFIAATNAADIYLTWYDAGRNRERNIERALHYAQIAMQKPTPMRACNLLLAFVKDKFYLEAQKVMETVLKNNLRECPAEKFLQTLFQIRDTDLVTWWSWLDGELGRE